MTGYSAVSTSADERGSRPASQASSGQRSRRSKHVHEGTASWLSSVVNLVNTIVGAGVLAMPLALSHMGILLGTIVIIWAGITAGFGLYLQTRCAKYLESGSASFFALSQITYPNAAVVFDAAIAIKCFGVGVSYLIIIGDLMPGVIQGFSSSAAEISFLVDRQFWVTAFMLVVIPLSFLRRLDSLKYTSFIALVSIGYLVILVLYHFGAGDTLADRGPVRGVTWAGAIPTLASFPVIVFAYTCHQNMFSILNEISMPTHRRTTSVVTGSIGSAAALYILVAITGYLSYGDNINSNIVSMYPPAASATIGRAAIVILVMFSYPLQVHPCRASVDAVLRWRPARRTGRTPSISTRHQDPSPSRSVPLLGGPPGAAKPRGDSMSDARFAMLSTAIIVLSYIVAMTVSSLEKVLAYVGSTGSTSISFILPGLFYYKISAPDSVHHQRLMKEDDDEGNDSDGDNGADDETMISGVVRGWKSRVSRQTRLRMLRRLSLTLACYGLVVMVVCLGTNTFLIAAH